MGSSNAKMPFANQCAQIGITLDKQFYYQGEIINGKVLLMVLQPVPLASIDFITKGSESTRFSYYEIVGSKKRRSLGQGKKPLMQSKVCIAKFSEVLLPGQYAFPFLMQIPVDVPPTFSYLPHGLIHKAKVSYKFKAIANSSDQNIGSIMSVLSIPILSRGSIDKKISSAVVNENEVICCCCCGKGTCKLEVTFEKASYLLGEPMIALISVDNSRCYSNVKALDLKLMRRCTVMSDANPSLHSSISDDVMHTTQYIEISKFTKTVAPIGVILDPKNAMNIDRLNILKRMPSCRGTLVDNFYILEVRAIFNTTVCCTSDVPESSIIVHIDSNDCGEPLPYKIPQNGWNPRESQLVRLNKQCSDDDAKPFAMSEK
jgi:hypothetical protein